MNSFCDATKATVAGVSVGLAAGILSVATLIAMMGNDSEIVGEQSAEILYIPVAPSDGRSELDDLINGVTLNGS